MADFENVRAAQQDLVLSKLSLAVLFARMDTPLLTTLEDPATGDLVELNDYRSAGFIQKDAGLSITSDIESSDIEGYGEVEPVRTIITKRTTRFNASFIETNREVIEKYWGIELDSTNMTVSAQGGVTVKAPPRPKNIFYRCVLLGQDEVNGEDLFPYWILPRVKLTEVDNMDFRDDAEIQYRMTFQAFRDPEGKFSVIQGWCGPGWRLLVDKTGFVAPPEAIVTSPDPITISVSETEQLEVLADNGINRTPNAKFESSDPTKASVSATGLVTGVAAGSATITVRYDPPTGDVLEDTVTVTVEA
ncbi:major tail protein [Mycobacterium phage EniyanLRS]|uniref:Major tail protein n=1 Tax=Mycobacterium phage EniyanLRS TaxID=1933770 RepID=A0A2H4GST4_9CAUD|nr:major tail protein [Mycobacterium phage EniyanLRS]